MVLGKRLKYNSFTAMRNLLYLAMIFTTALRANDEGELAHGNFVSKKFGFSVPVEDAWYLGPLTESANPSLIYRISDDQVLNIVFSDNGEPASVQALAQAYLNELKESPDFKLLTPIKPVTVMQNIQSRYFEFERGKAGEVRYRQGILMIPTHGNPLGFISVTEASEDPAYMTKALAVMKAITLDPERLPAPTKEANLNAAYQLGKRIGQYGFLGISVIFIVVLCSFRSAKRRSQPPPLPKT